MPKASLPDTISNLKEISKLAANYNADLSSKIDLAILDLQKIDVLSKTDQFIDRAKKISEILAPITKLLYDYFAS